MKVTRKGVIKLGPYDVRVGNFVYSVEDRHVKIQDIGGQMTHRVSTDLLIGQFLLAAMKDRDSAGVFLQNYAVMLWNVSCIVPVYESNGEVVVSEFMQGLDSACAAGYEKMKRLYNLKDDITPEEDAKILRDVREVEEAKDEVRKELGIKE